MGIDFGIWVATRCNRAAAGVKIKYQYLFNERIPSAKVQTRSIANDRCRENHDYYFLVLILNFKVFLLIIFFNGCVVKAWAQVVAYDSVGYLHPKSKIELSVKPYFALLMPYFPELNGLKLVVRERKQLIPLTTVPSVLNLFRSKNNWKIHINVSNQSVKLFDPILVKNMPDSAIIGVLGHELSHVKDFYTHKRNYS